MTRWFARYARREGLPSRPLRDAIERAERGLIDADLGGGLIKQRIARTGGGKSGGYRTIVAFKSGERAVFLFCFAKKDQSNLTDVELNDFKELGRTLLAMSEPDLASMVQGGEIQIFEEG